MIFSNSLRGNITGFSAAQQRLLVESLRLITSAPDGERIARDLTRRRIRFEPRLTDRAQTTLLRSIVLGPEVFRGNEKKLAVSLAGTLVHEHWHTRQNPLGKTWSFWVGMATRTHPMRLYEWPAYARQIFFLEDLAKISPDLRAVALAEAKEVRFAFMAHYGDPPA